MWYGKDTPELLKLKDEYKKITGTRADGELTVAYGQEDYNRYVEDLKNCIKSKITIGTLHSNERNAD